MKIDAEFIDLVISAQGGSLEGVAAEGSSIAEDLPPLPETSGSRLHASDNGLAAAVQDLSGRLTRLEGLVIEITSQMVPIMTKLGEKSSPPEQVQVSEAPSLPHTVFPEQKLNLDNSLQTRKSWWSRFCQHG
jgi:hypothetical protein